MYDLLISGFFAGHDPTRGSGHVVFKTSRVGSGRVRKCSNLTGRVGSGQEVFKSRGWRQVRSRVFQISRVGSGRVGSGQEGDEKLTGRVWRIRLADPTLESLPALLPKGFSRNKQYSTTLLFWYHIQTLKKRKLIYACPHPFIPTTSTALLTTARSNIAAGHSNEH